jgi:hypothetical protein
MGKHMRIIFLVALAAQASLICGLADEVVLRTESKLGYRFVPQTVTEIVFEISETGHLEMLDEGTHLRRRLVALGQPVQAADVRWDEDLFAPCRFSVTVGRRRFVTQKCDDLDPNSQPSWIELSEFEIGETLLASRFTEALPRRLLQVTSHGRVLVTEFFDDAIQEASTLMLFGGRGEMQQAEIQLPDELGARAAVAVGYGDRLEYLALIDETLQAQGPLSLPAVLPPGQWEIQWSADTRLIRVTSPNGTWQSASSQGGSAAWTAVAGPKDWNAQRSSTPACTYDYRLRDHRRNAWDNFLDFSASTHVFERMIKATNGTGRNCSPVMKIPASAASFVRVEASRSGAVIGDWNVVFRVSFYNGSTYRQRVLTLDQPRLGYDGLLVALSQNGNRTSSCSAFPLTQGLRRPMAQEYDPRFHRIVKIFIDYRNPGCSQQGNFALIACGRDSGAGGMLTQPVSGLSFGSVPHPVGLDWSALGPARRESSSTTTCVIDYDMHTGNFR